MYIFVTEKLRFVWRNGEKGNENDEIKYNVILYQVGNATVYLKKRNDATRRAKVQ